MKYIIDYHNKSKHIIHNIHKMQNRHIYINNINTKTDNDDNDDNMLYNDKFVNQLYYTIMNDNNININDNCHIILNYTYNLNNFKNYLYINNLIVNNILNNCENKSNKNLLLQFVSYSYITYLCGCKKITNFYTYQNINNYFDCIIKNKFRFIKCQFYGWCGNIYTNISNHNIVNYYKQKLKDIMNNSNYDYDINDSKLCFQNDYQILYMNNNLDYKDLSNYYNMYNICEFQNFFDICIKYITNCVLPNIDGMFIISINENNDFNIYSNCPLNTLALKNICNFEQFCIEYNYNSI